MLTTEPLFVEQGVPVFADHADVNLFWYLPARVGLAQRDGQPVLSFIKYRNAGGQGGGLLSFEVDLGLSRELRRKITGMLDAMEPRLVQVPFVDGSVQCVTLDAGADPARSGDAPRLVNQVLGAAHPSLQGDNNATFTLSLGPDGAEVVEAAMKGGVSLLGVIYQLDYTAMQPPLQVKVTAKMSQIYRFLGASVTAQYKFLRADLSAAIERMRADKNLIIERIDTIGTEASAKELDQAAKMFTDQLVRDWFTPMLIPGTPRTQMATNLPYNPNMPYNPNQPFNAGLGPNPYGMAGGGNGLGLGGGGIDPYNDPYATPGGNPLTPGGDPFNPGGNPLTPGGDPFNPGGSPLAPGGDPFNPVTALPTRALLRSAAPPPAARLASGVANPFDAADPPKPDGAAGEAGANPFDPPVTPVNPAEPTDTTPATPVPPPTPEQLRQAADQQAVDGASQALPMLASGAAAGAANAAAAALPLPQVTLQLKAIDQKELREFHAEYSSRIAVKRTYRPQGFFGLSAALLAQLPPSAFLEVDTDSAFWRKLEIAVHGPSPADFDKLGLASAVARIQYGATSPVDASFRFAPQGEPLALQQFSAPMRRGETDYQPVLTYAFDASWTGDPAPSELRLPRSEQRDIYLAPQRDFRFVVLDASFTDKPDWTQLSQVQLKIRCAMAGADGAQVESFEKNVVVRPDWVPGFTSADAAGPLPWRLRFRRRDDASLQIDYKLTWYFKDGRKQQNATIRTDNADLVLPAAP